VKQSQSNQLFMSQRSLCERWDRSHMFIQRLLDSDPEFPKPVKLGLAETAWWHWKLSEIEA
jgi:predicted DNA-binding transcriptional regulator AlpA